MKRINILLLSCSLFHLPSSLSAAVPLRWTVETSRLQPAVFDVVRGETLALEASFQSYGKPVSTSNMTAFLCWQTNGMASAWWTTNACTAAALSGSPSNVASVLFTPEMDPGAPVVNAFLGLSDSTNSSPLALGTSNLALGTSPLALGTSHLALNYRAAVTLRFRHGPGAAPNVIDQPPRILDLAHTVVVNPPWPTQADFSATTTVMKAELKNYVDDQITGAGLVSPTMTTNIAEVVVSNVVTKSYVEDLGIEAGLTEDQVKELVNSSTQTNGGAKAYADATFLKTNEPDTEGTISWAGEGIYIKGFIETSREITLPDIDLISDIRGDFIHDFYAKHYDATNAAEAVFGSKGPSDIGAYPNTSGQQLAEQVSTLNNGYTRLYNFATGATNANFSATNYPPTAAEAATRCHYQQEPGMDFSTVPASLQLNEYRDGAWRTVMDTRDWTVWYYRFKETQLTNEIARLKAENAVISNSLENAKAWANHTANGVENPMTDTLVVDRPNMWLMADYEWQKCVSGSNQCWVIRAKNVALSGGANTNGFLEICDAFGKPYMRVNKSAETFAEPVFESITYDDDDGAWYIVYGNSAKPTKGGANAEIVGNGMGKCILYDEDDPDCPATITWPESSDSHAGHWIMKAVPKPVDGVVPSKMFFGAEIKVAGKDYVEYVKEASFGAGIRVGNNVYEAVESGNTLIWQKKVD